MALMRDLSRAQHAFQVQGRQVSEFQVIRFRGTEGLNQLYRFEIEMAADTATVSFDDIVGKAAVLSIFTSQGERWFHGIVARFEMTGETHDQIYFRAELVPALWLLTHRYNSRIFQNKNVKEIITEVLTDAGIATDRFDTEGLPDSVYQRRENCVQYRETDFNFISRLCEDEGIWYFFEQSQDKHVVKFCAGPGFAVPIEGDPALPYMPPTGLNVEEEHIFRFRIAQAVRPGAVVLNDFNFENPKLNLEAKGDSGRDSGLGFIDFPGGYTDQDHGGTVAERRAQEFESSRVAAIGQSNCKRLGPGKIFELKEHPSTSFNGKYFITTVLHEGKESVLRTTTGTFGRNRLLDARVHQALVAARNENPPLGDLAEALLQIASRIQSGDPTANRALTQWLYHAGQVSKDIPATALAAGGNPLDWLAIPNLISDVARGSVIDFDAPVYECRFECVPERVTWRPPRVTPWPVMRGCQTARVVGPEGEEIHVDKYGRVRVQFHWDRQGSENGQPKLHGADSSCWIRVCQGWAGGQYGIMFIPRVGQEVVVDFLEGNPDYPLIIGRVYNADHMPPYELPKEKTKSCIKTQSSKGGGGCNEIRFEDLKGKEQLLLQAQRRMDTRVKASHYHSVGGSYHLSVGYEKDGEQHGEYRQLVHEAKHVHIKGDLLTWVEKDEHRAIGGKQNVEIGDVRSWLMRADAIDVFEANHQHEVSATYYLKAGDVKIEATGSIELVAGGSSVVISAGGVWITGSMVYINSGSGAPVSPTAVAGMSPGAAEDPSAAQSTKPGKDTRYSGASATTPGSVPIDIPTEEQGHDFDAPTFVEFQLLDASEQPVPNERYRVELPDGAIREGRTDSEGVARFEPVPDMGVAYIQFPDREDPEWRLLRVVRPGASGGGGSGGTTPAGGGSAPGGGAGGGTAPGAGGLPGGGGGLPPAPGGSPGPGTGTGSGAGAPSGS